MKQTATLQDWLQTGFRHHEAGRWDEAARWYARVRKAAPKLFEPVHLDGTRALQQGRFQEAHDLLVTARRLNPKSPLCLLRLGIALFGLQRFSEAEPLFRQAFGLDPKLAEAPFHLGQTLRRLGRLADAEAAFRQAIALRPDYAEAHDRMGALLSGWRGPLAAEPFLLRATELNPKLASSWCNLGLGWIFQGRLSDAIAAIGKAIEADPRFGHAHAAMGLALAKCYRPAAAIEAYGRALECDPGNCEAQSARLMELHYHAGYTAEQLFAEHLRFGRVAEPQPVPRNAPTNLKGRKLRIGFLSPDLHRHSVAYFLEPLLKHLDRARFELFLYHDSGKHDDMSDRLQAPAAVWRSLAGIPAEAVEKIVKGDRLDLLVDLAGHTGGNRLPLYARRLAPAQATYLGYPNTTGLRAMDYRLGDFWSDPQGSERHCTEKLVRFAPCAWSYSPPADSPDPAPSPAASGGAGVTFGCFNNVSKINDATLLLWGRVLAAVPDARLLLKGHGLSAPVLGADLRRRFAAAGIPSDRAVLLERTESVRDHLQAYGRVDIALDTFPYHGTTTTCEALWMGVPVITRAGDRHACRVGVSLLQAVGHPEWVAEDDDAYVRIAAQLASQIRSTAQTMAPRDNLRNALKSSVLMDHAGQAARFGTALEAMAEGTA